MTLKRFDLITNNRCGDSIEEMEPSDDGEWVRFEDVAPLATACRLDGCRQLGAGEIVCGGGHAGVGCGLTMMDLRDVYRCGDCTTPFHRSCLKAHFGTHAPANA